MEGMDVPFDQVQGLASREIYAHTRNAFLKNPGADGNLHAGVGVALPRHPRTARRAIWAYLSSMR